MDPLGATISGLLDGFASGAFSSEEAVRAFADRIEAHNGKLNAVLDFDPAHALEQARAIDARRAQGHDLGPLAGVPIAIKDNICRRGELTTCCSRMLASYRPPFDATVIRRLHHAGAVILGRLNMDEFAMGSSNETSCFGPARNPWDLERSPGGSSGGAAAAVAASLAPTALGSDTGGSIRQPAALTGVVGLKPTYGRVSRYGLVAFASSLDQIGPFGREVADVARVLSVIAGRDPMDSTSVDRDVPDYLAALESKPDRPLRVGLAREFFSEGLDPEVESAIREAARVFEAEGATVSEISLPNSKHAIPAYYIVAPAEASSNLARYDGTIFGHRAEDFEPKTDAEKDLPALIRMMMASRAEGFGPEVTRRIMLGTFVLSAGYADRYYVQALKVRRLIRDDFDRAFQNVDVILGPTSPVPAFKVGEKLSDPLAMYLLDVYTGPANLAGIPGISLPGGLTKSGLPIGIQLQAPAFAEETLLRAARIFERATDWHTKRPGLV
ncbi:Asp-tRNA(Asn)/Glu-tRNA(Gln) amidotransferase subunit GatA [Tautonia sociabilis]|uniref:Glutamyl-tRNA(Gln) amidotransferase subunit A n=1 Tax=Tautonia sociabilis TaxID=2080755 RepID=A0A432MFI8_9BACT|nr:Asp-tRNA(Asn)/Glu-tRNA(Gln) amidotransferase subunit GatA [Tautonia sociabilis]RUL84992.1 Asp-tRNA(Asn)/Glu-tRNA(Gln) amidotransferase subunit GatA [Tautonia sociabilis]